MWFNSMQRGEPYLVLTSHANCRDIVFGIYIDMVTGGAWLSSARVVRCSVKSGNERNPCLQLPARNGGNFGETVPNGEGRWG